ncbi:unnamed protein product [Gongylonema pulchrum]|uniref:Uncharacterized protein n=1 Tax=Gongylonema pulchrum TaxID=637853 RepID=A0A183ESH4_9BILA|nr:unnamed protein product [Gongylonema pulchrum]
MDDANIISDIGLPQRCQSDLSGKCFSFFAQFTASIIMSRAFARKHASPCGKRAATKSVGIFQLEMLQASEDVAEKGGEATDPTESPKNDTMEHVGSTEKPLESTNVTSSEQTNVTHTESKPPSGATEGQKSDSTTPASKHTDTV